MALLDDFGNILFRNFTNGRIYKTMMSGLSKPTTVIQQKKTVTLKEEKKPFFPTGTTRSSVEPVVTSFSSNYKLSEVKPEFAIEYLATLENLAAFNADVSYAVDNIVSLANTPHEIIFSDKVPEAKQKEMRTYLNEVENSWYAHSDGKRSLKGDLIAQAVINGAISAEIIPADDLRSLKKVVRVSPKNIRFVYDSKEDRYDAFQVVNNFKTSDANFPGKVRLNPLTYKYIAMRRYFESPYAVPPFITTIESLCIQRPMIISFKNIMDKLGMLGFLTANVTPPEQNENEEDEAFWNRCINYLDNYVYPQIQDNL